jgi:hypothetical protein
MPPPAQPADRHEPLPGLFGLPGHLLRQLSPPVRRLVVALAVLALAGCVATAIVLGPRISDSNRRRAAEQHRADRRAQAQELARLRAEQRPRVGVLDRGPAIAGVERAVTRDAQARVATGELETRVRRTDCESLGHDAGRLVLGCTAITSDVPASAGGGGLVIGYPYSAAVTPATGRYAICKTSGRPGEGYLTRRETVALPRACGG